MFLKHFSKTFQKFISALKEDILMDNKNLFSIGDIAKAVGLVSIPDEKEMLELIEEMKANSLKNA